MPELNATQYSRRHFIRCETIFKRIKSERAEIENACRTGCKLWILFRPVLPLNQYFEALQNRQKKGFYVLSKVDAQVLPSSSTIVENTGTRSTVCGFLNHPHP